jgi:hypothetical protein
VEEVAALQELAEPAQKNLLLTEMGVARLSSAVATFRGQSERAQSEAQGIRQNRSERCTNGNRSRAGLS